MRSLDTFTYYPGSGGKRGIVFYQGIIDNNFIYGGTTQDGYWFRVSAGGEAAIQKIFDIYNISVGESSPLDFIIPTGICVWLIYCIIPLAIGIVIILYRQGSIQIL